MANYGRWWAGQDPAIIPDLSWVDAKWGKGAYSANRLRMINGAFETYCLLRQSIGQCSESSMRQAMINELEDAARTGWGMGVHDLDDAFQHWDGPGHWKDEHTDNYIKASGTFGGATPAIKGAKFCWGLPTNIMPDCPTCAVNFFDALDSKMDDLNSSIRSHNSAVQALGQAVANKNGGQTGDALSAIAKAAKAAQKFMFLAPKPDDTFLTDVATGSPGAMSTAPPRDSFNRFVGGGSARPSGSAILAGQGTALFLQATVDLDTFLSVHRAMLTTGIFDNKTSTEFAALAVALGKVPVLGGFYAEMVKNLPGFFANMRDLFEEHYRKIDRETRVN
ncbi:MAG: hypothetical protein ACLQLC_10875 [Candidatus Sulfotelmatobacter sp.]